MSQNIWATIMPFGPVTIIFYWPKKKIQASQRLDLISGTEIGLEIIVAQTFCDIFLFYEKKDIRYQYINSFQINCFFINNIKIHSFTSLTRVGGALQGNIGRYRCAAEINKKMSQNVWATIVPFGPVTIIFYWPKKNNSGQPKAGPHFRHRNRSGNYSFLF
jgi:hypothetical protein